MHYYGERFQHLCLPGSSYATESLRVCVPQADVRSTTCHPLSVTKGPAPRWPSYLQPFTPLRPQQSGAPPQSVVPGPEACETTCLLPCAKPSGQPGAERGLQPCHASCPEKKRVAKSLPPCATKCPEPGKLRFPPCGIRYSSSCKDECAAPRGSKCCPPRAMPGGYSQPLQGGTECPPQQCVLQECVLQECVLQERGGGFPPPRCTKGYPTQECVAAGPPQPPAAECPPGQGVKGCPLLPGGAKQRCSVPQHPTKSRCVHPCASQHVSRHRAGRGKGSSHAKKSCCAAKCLC